MCRAVTIILSVKAFTVTLNSHNNAMCIGSVTIMLCVGACSNKCVIIYVYVHCKSSYGNAISMCKCKSQSCNSKSSDAIVMLYVRAITIMLYVRAITIM